MMIPAILLTSQLNLEQKHSFHRSGRGPGHGRRGTILSRTSTLPEDALSGYSFSPDLTPTSEQLAKKVRYHLNRDKLAQADYAAKEMTWIDRNNWEAYKLRG
jgi:hypothetical protein